MLSYRFAALSFALAASASTSAFAGAGTLVATVTPLSNEVTYSDGVTPTSMKTYAGYSVLFANNSPNTINDVHFRVSLVAGYAANMPLVPGYLPLPACVQVTADTTTFECTIPQMKSQDRFPSDGKPFIVLYNVPGAPSDLPYKRSVTANVVVTYAEGANGANPGVNSVVDLGNSTGVTLGTTNGQLIKSALPKSGGALRSGGAGIPTASNLATELLAVPNFADIATYATAQITVDPVLASGSDPDAPNCLSQGHFYQCPKYTTSIPTDPRAESSPPLQFTVGAPLSMTYRIHPSNLKLSAAKTLNSVLISYQKDGVGETPQQVTAICPTSTSALPTTDANYGRPCIAPAPLAPFCYKRSTPGWTLALDGVCEWTLNNIQNGLLKLE